jgi:hypothetical protein
LRLAFGVALGLVLAYAALCLLVGGLFPGEVEDVVRFRTLTHVAEPASAFVVDAANERGLILVHGVTSSPEPVSDPLLPLDPTNALALVRRVEMFQWIEKAADGTSNVRYEGAWAEELVGADG